MSKKCLAEARLQVRGETPSQRGRRGRLLPAYCLLPCLLELDCTTRSFPRVQILGCFSPCVGHLKQSPTKLGRKFGSCELQTLFSITSALRGVHRRLHSMERWFEGENDAIQARVPKSGPEFHHKIGTKRLRVVFNGRGLLQIKTWAPYVNTSAAYRARAKACAKLAEVFNDPHAKPVLARMAEAWLRLADYVERRERNEVGRHFDADNSHDHDANPE
jgi:hypothetical protein